MVTVSYTFELPYLYGANQRRAPGLLLQISNPDDSAQTLETDAYLDSGTERSLFDGQIAAALGLDLLSGR